MYAIKEQEMGKNNSIIFNKKEGKEIWVIGRLLFLCYKINKRTIRNFIRWLVLKLEKGMYFSITIRKIFLRYYGIEVGLYSGCGGFSPLIFKSGTTIGRYTTVTPSAKAFNSNHPINTKSSHALFFNPKLGIAQERLNKKGKLIIGNDVFIGHNVVILPSVHSIADGVYIGASAVLSKDPPPYSIIVGNPARVIGYRYPKKKITEMIKSKWWEKSLGELKKELETFQHPLDNTDRIK